MEKVEIIAVTEGNVQVVAATFTLNAKGTVTAKYDNDMIKRDLADGARVWDDKAKTFKTFRPKDGEAFLKAIMRTYTGHRVRAVEV